MRSLRQVLGRSEPAGASIGGVDGVAQRPESWNTLSTIGVGSVADVAATGAIYPRSRALVVEIWFGSGGRWVRGGADAGNRQSRVVGLPVIETRQRVGDGDVIQTAWADESGDGRGRVVIELANETDVAVVAAIVVRPARLLETGSIKEIRVAGTLIVADQLPIVEIGREPGDVAVAVDEGSGTGLLEVLQLSADSLIGHDRLVDDRGRASLAAMIPLTAGVNRQIQVLDGREAATVAPAPLDKIVSGWRSHLEAASEIELPGWPKHVPPALMSSLLGAVADPSAPLGDQAWKRRDDASLAVALGGVGLHWGAAEVVDRLLEAVTDGSIQRSAWPAVAAACAVVAGTPVGDATLERHGDSAVAVAGEVLTKSSTPGLDFLLHDVVRSAHGDAAARDAKSITGTASTGDALSQLGRLGVSLTAQQVSALIVESGEAKKPLDEFDLALSMILTRNVDRAVDAVIPVRARAGTTWRWARSQCGDSPHARAALLIGLRSLCISTTSDTIDVVPGMQRAWLGQNLRASRLPTPFGTLSYAVRWHGSRAALLWEMEDHTEREFTMTCRSIDPAFATTERSGETLLEEPTHLVSG